MGHQGFENSDSWVPIWALPVSGYAALGKSLHLSAPFLQPTAGETAAHAPQGGCED